MKKKMKTTKVDLYHGVTADDVIIKSAQKLHGENNEIIFHIFAIDT